MSDHLVISMNFNCHIKIVKQNTNQSYVLQSKLKMISPLQVRPVLKRAGSVKQIGAAVLDSRVSSYAADRIDGALNVADKYVDKYLPSGATDQVDCKWNVLESIEQYWYECIVIREIFIYN